MNRKLPDDFEVRHIHRELQRGRQPQQVTIFDESGIEVGATSEYKNAPFASTAPDPAEILSDYDPRNHHGKFA